MAYLFTAGPRLAGHEQGHFAAYLGLVVTRDGDIWPELTSMSLREGGNEPHRSNGE